MSPDAQWPNLPAHGRFTPAHHAAHTTGKGLHLPQDLYPNLDSRKAAKQLMKFVNKPHLKMNRVVTKARRKKKV